MTCTSGNYVCVIVYIVFSTVGTTKSTTTTTGNNNSPKSLTSSTSTHNGPPVKATAVLTSNNTKCDSKTSSADTTVKNDPQTNGEVIHNNTAGHYSLPPPPDISHTSVAEQVCGISPSSQPVTVSPSSEEEGWRGSQRSVTTTTSEEWEELQEHDLHLMSKQVSGGIITHTHISITGP